MEEIEVPTEHLHEAIHEKAEEAKEKRREKEWSMMVAISTAVMAVFAALAGLEAGDHVNEAMFLQIQASVQTIKASDQWAYYQAKGIKGEIKAYQKDTAAVAKYKTEQQEITKQANEYTGEAKKLTEESQEHLKKHVPLSRAVTFFQISIAISAISILSQKRFLWFVALALTITGIVFFFTGVL
jgi:hypothetical protein